MSQANQGNDPFLDLVAAAKSAHAASRATDAAAQADAAISELERAARSMDIIEPILQETVDALRRLGVRTSKLDLLPPRDSLGPAREGILGGGWVAGEPTSRSIEDVGAYRRSIGFKRCCKGWKLRGPIDCGVTWHFVPETGSDKPRPVTETLNHLLLEHRLRAWTFSHVNSPCAIVAGEPRCYVKVKIVAQHAPERRSSKPPELRIVPDVFRRSLAEAVARLASGH